MKETMKVCRPKLSFLVTFPQAKIGLPSAPAKRGPEVAAEDLCGKTETTAPVSTRNCCLDTESWRKMRPPRALSCPQRQPSFPPTDSLAGSCWRQPPTSCECSKCRVFSYHLFIREWGGGAAGGRRRGDLARRSGDLARRLGEAERTETAARDSTTAETEEVFLASQRISACADISVDGV